MRAARLPPLQLYRYGRCEVSFAGGTSFTAFKDRLCRPYERNITFRRGLETPLGTYPLNY